MTIWSIGAASIYGDEDSDPSEFLRVISDAADSSVTALFDTGDHASFAMACREVSRLFDEDQPPTTLAIASYVGGSAATLHEVMTDGTLRDWRDDDEIELTLEEKFEDVEAAMPRISLDTGTMLKVTNWVTGETIFEGDPDTASGLADGTYAGESDRFYGTVFVADGRIVAVSS